ncbi:hypothetical protein [Natronorubrum sp. DTA7]|uniref:hypothetical protein n=1 Tax=Natronorubrum sp. DTA7 TaxID=3447016 RepID=UPI003F8707A8
MQRNSLLRRTAPSLTVGTVLVSLGVTTVSSETDEGVTRRTVEILEGTEQKTMVYATAADAAGLTGGVYGTEVAGSVTTEEGADWVIDAVTLVTVLESNAVAVERETHGRGRDRPELAVSPRAVDGPRSRRNEQYQRIDGTLRADRIRNCAVGRRSGTINGRSEVVTRSAARFAVPRGRRT